MLKLNLGCGPHIKDGWHNLDLEPGFGGTKHDLTKPLPYAKESVSFIYSEHFIEHITREQAVALFKECFRVLKPEGVIRLSTPCLERLVMDYQAGKIDRWDEIWKPKNPCQMLNGGMRLWGHQHLFDAEDLAAALWEAGFTHAKKCRYQLSGHASLDFQEMRPYHNELIMEAWK